MAERREFDNQKDLQPDLQPDSRFGEQTGDDRQCAEFEAMLADAQRGAEWLQLLRAEPPEPPAALLERILAETSGAQIASARGYAAPAATASYGNAPSFRSRLAAAMRQSSFAQILLQPRLAMTAAMAFFSIALTLNLTGIHPLGLRLADLSPASIKRDFYSANTRVVQYYEGLRVVYELESRVHDFEGVYHNEVPAGSQSAPFNAPPKISQPQRARPSARPGPGGQKAAPPAGSGQPEPGRREVSPGASLRDGLTPNRSPNRGLLAATRSGKCSGIGFYADFDISRGISIHTRMEGGQA